jgi:hypothetical protein
MKMCPEARFGDLACKEWYHRLAAIIGQWAAERDRLDISPLMETFRAIRGDLERIAKTLSGHEEGFREIHDIKFVSLLASLLAEDPEVGSRQQANKLIDSFRRDAAKLAHACSITAHELNRHVGQRGRPRSVWYDDLTALLLEIAHAAGVKPRLSKERVSGERVGWLVEAAEALETFLDPDMWSPSKEARGKRLERSLRTLKQRHRQKPPSD